jgi:hypothetical protein
MHDDQKPYDQFDIDNIKRTIDEQAQEGSPLYFEVKVDDKVVIHATNNPERFDSLYNFINEKSKTLVISVFVTAERGKKDFYRFLLNGTPPEKTLEGLPDVDKIVNDKMQTFKDQTAMERLQEKLMETKQRLEEAEAYSDSLQAQLEALRAQPNHFGGLDLGKLAGSAVKEIALHYPKVLEKVPVLNGIAKVIQDDEQTRPHTENPSFEGEVSFKAKNSSSSEPKEDSEMNENIAFAKQLGQFISENFEEEQIATLAAVIEALGEDTSQLIPVAELLNINVGKG